MVTADCVLIYYFATLLLTSSLSNWQLLAAFISVYQQWRTFKVLNSAETEKDQPLNNVTTAIEANDHSFSRK
jgi:hypothetical protein